MLACCCCCPKTLYLHLVPPGTAESVFQPSFERMHFPTLPKRWRLPSSEATAKPPKHGRQASASPRKSPYKLYRSASFSSDPVFKVPPAPQPQRRPSFSLTRSSWEANKSEPPASQRPCPNCCQSNVQQQPPQKQDWKSRSLVDLQPQRTPARHHQPQQPLETASIFSNNLRSNSWRNLSLIGGGKNADSSGGAILSFKKT